MKTTQERKKMMKKREETSDRPKRIFLYRPKTNVRQEYSADNEYSAQGSKHCKSVKVYKEKYSFLGWHLQVAVDTMLDGHDLWATETKMHTKLTMSTKSLLSRENIAWK
jgi:hypothetical protein